MTGGSLFSPIILSSIYFIFILVGVLISCFSKSKHWQFFGLMLMIITLIVRKQMQ